MEHWEDAIDIDDSDLTSLLHNNNSDSNSNKNPNFPLQPCSLSRINPPNPLSSLRPSPRPFSIPGPAAAVQAAMHHRKSNFVPFLDTQGHHNSNPVLDIDADVEETEEDEDFKMHPWLSAVAFLGKDFDLRTPIRLIKNHKSAASDRLPQVAGVVKSCVPNGLGDLFVTLKDPTGTVGASIHRNFVKDNNLGSDIIIGCVLILKQVVVFCPGRSVFYLNITPKNIVKIVNKDCGPHKQIIPSYKAISGASDEEEEIRPGPVDRMLNSVRQTEESTAGHVVGKDFNKEMMIECRKTVLCGNSPHDSTAKDANMSSLKPNLSRNNSRSISTKFDTETSTTNIAAKIDPRANATVNMAGESDCRTNSRKSIDATKNMTRESNANVNGPIKMISRVSVTQWTDEQLLELFADYQDDADLFHRTI